ncbi:MAG: alkaline phosphatase family protein [Sphingobacteriales bacterium]|nr:MAG: alkaline phosphatase family protein [Sphingobacteriales bacterium]
MKRVQLLLLTLICASGANAQTLPRPKLVVGIVVDQMRWDYLYRYYDRYEAGGFKRLMTKGFNCQNTMINYLPSFTAPGHACVYTGTVPSVHGIAANDWIDNQTGRHWYCTEDTAVSPVGGSLYAGKMSPRNMHATTVTDELRLATNMRSKVFGIAIKDRGSILPAGHMANGAYWFDDSTGNFITSSFYGNRLPDWLTTFNNKRLADSLVDKDWTTLYPLNTYVNSVEDNSKYEGKLPGEQAPVFPHSAKGMRNRGYQGLRYLPGGNTITFEAAKACIAGEQLGSGNSTDFLCVSFSSTDYAGHQYGPNAIEMEDMFLRMDKELAAFLPYLDSKVGAGNYTIFLTADHGGAHNTGFMKDRKAPAGNADAVGTTILNQMLEKEFGTDSIVRTVYNYQVYFNEDVIARKRLSENAVVERTKNWIAEQEGVSFVVDMHDRGHNVTPEPLRTMIVNGYNRARSGRLQIIPQPGWYGGHSGTGTTHGTWNPYDTHIPLLWYGWGIPKGETYRKVQMTDIAATLAALLHIQQPNGCIGEPIAEILK